MEFLNVIAAAAGAWLFGAVWYMALSKPWMAASGVKVGPDGRPANGSSPMPFVISFIMLLVVSGMLRHVFSMTPAIDTLGEGVVGGLGVGLFLITPWIALNNAYTQRPLALTLIDGGYAAIGCAIAGGILVLF